MMLWFDAHKFEKDISKEKDLFDLDFDFWKAVDSQEVTNGRLQKSTENRSGTTERR